MSLVNKYECICAICSGTSLMHTGWTNQFNVFKLYIGYLLLEESLYIICMVLLGPHNLTFIEVKCILSLILRVL